MNANYDRSMCVDEPAFRFCWLRENMPSHVDFDTGFLVARPDLLLAILGLHPGQQRLGRRVYITMRDVESGNLPEWAVRRMAAMIGPFRSNLVDWQAVARRIGEAAAPVPGIVELHLPYVDRRRWPHRIEVLERTEFALRGSLVAPAEMIDKAPRWNEYVARLIGALAVKGKGDVPLRCWFHKRVYGPLLDPLLPARLSNLPADRPVDVCVEFSLDPAACSAWLRSPAEVSGAYHPIHSQVSVAVQTALRRWMAFEWFDNEETFQDLLSAYTMLGYSAMTPYAKRIRTEFTYDTMDPEWMRGIFKHSRGQLREVLRAARRELLASGCKTLASWYYPANAKYIMDRVRRQRRNLHQLVELEAGIVNRLLRMGVELRCEQNARRASAAAAECAQSINTRLRHSMDDRDCSALGAIIMFEATNALHEALGGTPALRVDMRVDAAPAPEALAA